MLDISSVWQQSRSCKFTGSGDSNLTERGQFPSESKSAVTFSRVKKCMDSSPTLGDPDPLEVWKNDAATIVARRRLRGDQMPA
jgi:hypothetical protein